MKIQQLAIQNFSSHLTSTLEFKQPIALIVGQLNAGKSSILQSIEYALTGECGYYRKRTDDRADMIHDLGGNDTNKHFLVDVVADKFHAKRVKSVAAEVCEFNNQAAPNVGQMDTAIQSSLGVSKQTISAVLNTSNFFELDVNTQKELIIALVGAEVTHDKVVALFKDDADALKRLTIKLDSIQALQRAHDLVYARRRDVNRELKELRPPLPPEGERPDINKINSLLSEYEAKLQGVITARGRLQGQGDVASVRQSLVARKTSLVESKMPAGTESLMTEAIKMATAEHDGFAVLVAAMEKKLIDVKSQRMSVGKNVALLSNFNGRCVAGDHECPADPADMQRAMVLQSGLAEKLSKDEFQLTRELDVLRQKHNDRTAIDHAQNALSDWRLKTQNYQTAGVEIEKIDKQLATLQAPVDNSDAIAKLDKEMDDLRTRVGKGKQILQDASAWMERDRQVKAVAEKRQVLEVESRHMESLVDFLGPKGVKVQLIDERIGRFADAINLHLKAFGFELKITVEPWQISAKGRPLNRLSRSERFRLGIAFQCAIAKMTGINAVFIDDAEILTPDARRTMFQMLMAAQLDQAIVVCTLMDEPTFLKSRPGMPPFIEVFMVTNQDGVSTTRSI